MVHHVCSLHILNAPEDNVTSVMSVRLSGRIITAPNERIYVKFYTRYFYDNLSRNPTYVKIWPKSRALFVKTYVRFTVSGNNNRHTNVCRVKWYQVLRIVDEVQTLR